MKAEIIPVRPARKLQKRVSNGSSNGHAPIAIKKILAPTDFSPASEKGLKYALRFAREFRAEVTLLHSSRTNRAIRIRRPPDAVAGRGNRLV